MRRSIYAIFLLPFLLTACVTVNPPVKDAETSFNYGKELMADGKLSFAIIEFKKAVEKYDEAALRGLHSYKTTSGMPQSQVLGDILMHLFNHQTHHRGQAHACLSILTGSEPPSLDLLAFQRGGTALELDKLIGPATAS